MRFWAWLSRTTTLSTPASPPMPPVSTETHVRMPVTAIAALHNWQAFDIAPIADDPAMAVDTTSIAHSSVNGGSAWVRFDFDTPNRALFGEQQFRVRVRGATTGLSIEAQLYENGVLRKILGKQSVSTASNGTVLFWTWDSQDVLSSAHVQLQLILSDNVPNSYYQIYAIDWYAQIDQASTGGGPAIELPVPLRVVSISNSSQLFAALDNAMPGDHIILSDGVYNLNGRMRLTRSGTAQNPIVIRAQNVLGAKLPGGFEYLPDTSHVWLWGLDFKDARFSRLSGRFHKIRRCRFWPKPNYSDNSSSVAVVPYNGSDCEISYCELRLHTYEEALAENPSLWGNNTVYGVIHPYFRTSGSDTPFYRLTIARCLLTGGPSNVPYNNPNCAFIEAAMMPSYAYNTFCDWVIQDCYGNVPRDLTIFDFKCSGFKMLRCHIISRNGTFQLREGQGHRIERCRLTGMISVTRGPGHLIANTAASAIRVMAGECAYDDFTQVGHHGQSYKLVIANSSGSLTVGHRYNSNFTFPALDTLIEKHTGTISYGLHERTVVRADLRDSGVIPADPVTLTASAVGPLAPWAGVDEPPTENEELPTPLRVVSVSSATELTNALSNARPGDHIVLANGTYNGPFNLTINGTSANPVVVRAANKLGAIIFGGFRIQANYQIIWGVVIKDHGIPTWTGNFCKVLRCKFDGGIRAADTSTINVRGADNVIARCEFANLYSRGISIIVRAGAVRTYVGYNWFHDVITDTATNNFNVAVRIGESSLDEPLSGHAIIEYNLFERYRALYGETVSIKSSENIIRYNTLLDCRDSTIYNRLGHNNTISANIVKDLSNYTGGICVEDRDNILLGNYVIGPNMRIDIFAGNRRPDERDTDYNPPAYHPAAWNTILAGNHGPVLVGRYFSSVTPPMTINAKNTRIEAHDGPITYQRHEGTTVSPTTSYEIPTAVELTPSQVGPNS